MVLEMRHGKYRALPFTLGLLALVSCGSLLPKPTPKEIFILGAKEEIFCESREGKGKISEIRVQASPDFFRSQKIYFRKDSQLGNYQFAEWSEPLTDRIQRLITEKLRCQGFEIASAASENPERSILNINILDFSQDISATPGKFGAVFRITQSRGEKISEELFSFETPVEVYDVQGARLAADQIVKQLLGRTVEFVAASEL